MRLRHLSPSPSTSRCSGASRGRHLHCASKTPSPFKLVQSHQLKSVKLLVIRHILMYFRCDLFTEEPQRVAGKNGMAALAGQTAPSKLQAPQRHADDMIFVMITLIVCCICSPLMAHYPAERLKEAASLLLNRNNEVLRDEEATLPPESFKLGTTAAVRCFRDC